MSSNQNLQSPIHRAVLEVPNHRFEAYGATTRQALSLLEAALKFHGKQRGMEEGWYIGTGIQCDPVELGQAYYDGKPLQFSATAATAPALPLYQQAFPNFGLMDVEIPDGFEDVSYRNDVCPSFSKPLFNGESLHLFIERAIPTDRENPEFPRFFLALHDVEDTFLQMLLHSDDYSKVQEAIDAFEPAITPFQFIRDVSRMTRGQINDLYQEKVGYRPDDEAIEEEDVLILNTAEIAFYHAGGNETHWPKASAPKMLAWIRDADQRLGMPNRRFSIHSRDLPAPVQQEDVPLNFFLRMNELSGWDKFDIELLKVDDKLFLEKGEGAYIVTRLK